MTLFNTLCFWPQLHRSHFKPTASLTTRHSHHRFPDDTAEPPVFKWLLRKWPPFSKCLLSWKTNTRGHKLSQVSLPCQQCATHRALLSPLSIFSGLLEGRDYYSHSTQKETEAQGDEMTSLKQVVIKWQSWDLNQELPNFKTRRASALLQNTRPSEPVEEMTYGYVFPALFHLFISNNSHNSRNCSLWIECFSSVNSFD